MSILKHMLYVLYSDLNKICISVSVNKLESCINRSLNKVPIQEIFVNLTSINQTPVYSEHKGFSPGSSV